MNIGLVVGLACFFMFLNTKLPETPNYSQSQQQLNKFLGQAPDPKPFIQTIENASQRAQYHYLKSDTVTPATNALNSFLSGREIK